MVVLIIAPARARRLPAVPSRAERRVSSCTIIRGPSRDAQEQVAAAGQAPATSLESIGRRVPARVAAAFSGPIFPAAARDPAKAAAVFNDPVGPAKVAAALNVQHVRAKAVAAPSDRHDQVRMAAEFGPIDQVARARMVGEFDPIGLATDLATAGFGPTDQLVPAKAAAASSGSPETGPTIGPIEFRIAIAGTTGDTINRNDHLEQLEQQLAQQLAQLQPLVEQRLVGSPSLALPVLSQFQLLGLGGVAGGDGLGRLRLAAADLLQLRRQRLLPGRPGLLRRSARGDRPPSTRSRRRRSPSTSRPRPPAAEDWMPLGVFAVTTDGEPNGAEPTMFLQLAVSKQGVISGTFQNTATDTAQQIEGMVDKETQRAAWVPKGKQAPIMETGISNLTQDTTPALVHFADGTTQQWLLVRLDQAEGGCGDADEVSCAKITIDTTRNRDASSDSKWPGTFPARLHFHACTI